MDNWWPLVLSFAIVLTASKGDRATPERIRVSRSRNQSAQSGESNTETRYKWEGSISDDGFGDGSRKARAKCVDIPQAMGLCRGIGYLKMRLPNLLGHETLTEVQREAISWTPLLSTRCSNNTQLFLCTLFSPVCLDQPIWPCQSLCFEVKRGCEAPMASHGYPWPDMLNCEKLPSDNDLCIGVQTNRSSKQKSNGQSSCKVCENITSGMDAAVDKICQAEFVAKIRPDMVVISGNDLKIMPAKKVKFYKNPSSSVSNKHRQTFYIQDGARCDCFDLPNSSQYIVMGRMTEKQRLALTSVVKYDPTSKADRQALRTMKKSDGCSTVNNEHRRKADLSERSRKAIRHGKKRNGRKHLGLQSHEVGKRGSNKHQKERRKKGSNRNRNPKRD